MADDTTTAAELSGFLRTLAPDDAHRLVAAGSKRSVPRGGALFLEGDHGDQVFVLLAGRVKVFRTTPEGRELVLSLRGPGDLVGEMAPIDGQGTQRSASVFALEPVTARVLTGDEFRSCILERPAVGLALLRMLTRRLRDADRRRAEFGGYDTSARVARLLVELCPADAATGPGGSVELDLVLTQAELASMVGASRESVVRALTDLRTRGLIRTGRRAITVTDPDGLRSLSD